MDIFRVAGIAVVTLVLTVTVKSYRPEMGLHVALAGGAVLVVLMLSELSGIFSTLKGVLNGLNVGEDVIMLVVKVVGIAYTGQIAVDICRDAGESALASKTEICARVLMASASLPMLIKLLRMLTGLIENYL